MNKSSTYLVVVLTQRLHFCPAVLNQLLDSAVLDDRAPPLVHHIRGVVPRGRGRLEEERFFLLLEVGG